MAILGYCFFHRSSDCPRMPKILIPSTFFDTWTSFSAKQLSCFIRQKSQSNVFYGVKRLFYEKARTEYCIRKRVLIQLKKMRLGLTVNDSQTLISSLPLVWCFPWRSQHNWNQRNQKRYLGFWLPLEVSWKPKFPNFCICESFPRFSKSIFAISTGGLHQSRSQSIFYSIWKHFELTFHRFCLLYRKPQGHKRPTITDSGQLWRYCYSIFAMP